MRLMDGLCDRLGAVAALPAPVSLPALSAVSGDIHHAKRFVSTDAPIRFRKEMWEYPAVTYLDFWCKRRTDGTDRYLPNP